MISIKIHKTYREVVAVCDSELIGKYFEEGEFQLDVKESFYKGEEISKEELEKKLQKLSSEDSTFNIVGERSIQCAVNSGLISKDRIKKIQGIPFALVLL